MPARERARALSRHARAALALSAEQSGIELGPLDQDARGAPLPFRGWHWSVTHKPLYVAGVVAPEPIGVDLEEVRACSPGLYRRIAASDEWALATGADRQPTFFRFWTAKEAVLKIGGEGIKDLGRCRIARIVGPCELRVEYAGREWVVDQVVFDRHVAAVATAGLSVRWVMPQGEGVKGSRDRGVK